jgi:hypothetical protein
VNLAAWLMRPDGSRKHRLTSGGLSRWSPDSEFVLLTARRTSRSSVRTELASPALLLPIGRASSGRASQDLPDSAHGFLFQHHGQCAADVYAFLEEAE